MDPDNKKCLNVLKIVKKCEDLKERGNEHIKAKKYEEAYQCYSQALELDPFNKNLNSIIYSNRALALMKMDKLGEALTDCNKSLELNSKYIKSLLRRAEIKTKMGDHDAALYDYQTIKQIDPCKRG